MVAPAPGSDATKARLPLFLAIGVVMGACALRLALIHTARFCGDEADFWSMARSIAMGDAQPLLGPPVTGGAARHPGPAFYYIMAIPELLSKAPEADNAFVALLGGLSVGLYWDALRRSFSPWSALLASALLACAPWSTLFNDRIWNANLLCVLVVVAFWAACRLRERPDSWLVVPFLALCIVLPQVHMPAPVALTALGMLAWPALRKAKKLRVALGIALGIALYTPFILNEMRTGFGDTRAILSETGATRTLGWALVPLYVFRMLTTDISYQMLAGYWGGLDEPAALRFQFLGNADFPVAAHRLALFVLSMVFALVALGWGLRSLSRLLASDERVRWVGTFRGAAFVGFAANVGLLALTGKAIFAHYVASLLPFYFVIFAALGDELLVASERVRRAVLGLAVATAVGGIDATLHASRAMDVRNGLGTQRAVLEQIYAEIRPGVRTVTLSAPFRLDMAGYNSLSRLVYDRPLYFVDGAPLSYRLRPRPGRLGASSGVPVLDLGGVVLYRISP